MKLPERIESHARLAERRIAYREVSGARREITYCELWRAARRLAGRLQDVRRGDIVMICLPNRVEFPVALLGAILTGCDLFPVSPESTQVELVELARETKATAIIGTARACAAVKNDVSFTVGMEEVLIAENQSGSAEASGHLLLCSSGTTNRPKIVIRDAASLDAVASGTSRAVGFRPEDRVLAIVPLCHSYGLEHGLLAPLWAASTVHLCDGLDLAMVMSELSGADITLFPSVPSVYEMICQNGDDLKLPALRQAYAAGAPLPANIADTFATKFGVRIGQLYGATEIGSVAYADPDNPHFDPRSVGLPFEGVRVKIIDPATQTELSAGVEGEVCIAAPSMFRGYLHETTPSTIDGFFPTGDLGRVDPFGNLTITGRIKLLIEVGGQKVNVLELEALLARHPSVAEAAVVEMKVSQTVSRLKAVVTPADATHPPVAEELREFLRQRVAAYKVPRVIEVRETLPRSPAGKILRRMLEEA